MVLAFWQHEADETKLANLLGTRYFGTPAPNIHRLEQLEFLVTYESGSLSAIKSHLDENVPCLVFVQTGVLPYWKDDTAHVIVTIGMDETTVFVNDPAVQEAPQAIPVDYFLLAWSEFDYRYAVIQPK
jgi:hypothetical protein